MPEEIRRTKPAIALDHPGPWHRRVRTLPIGSGETLAGRWFPVSFKTVLNATEAAAIAFVVSWGSLRKATM